MWANCPINIFGKIEAIHPTKLQRTIQDLYAHAQYLYNMVLLSNLTTFFFILLTVILSKIINL